MVAITSEVITSMAERRSRKSKAFDYYVETHMNTGEAIDIANRMTDLMDAILALQPYEVVAIHELATVLWEREHLDRGRFLDNVQSIADAA